LQHEHASLVLAQRCSAVRAPLPLFSALLNYRHNRDVFQSPAAEAKQAWKGIKLLDEDERSNYPFSLDIDDTGDGFVLTAQVEASIEAMRVCQFMHTALEGLVGALETAPATAVGSINVLPESERRQLLEEWNNTILELGTSDSSSVQSIACPAKNAIEYEAPRGETESAIAAIWSDVLKVRKIGRHDNFFVLGGHSLLALQVVNLLKQAGIEILVANLFAHPTIESLATQIVVQGKRRCGQEQFQNGKKLP
jgi:aryl carrier-like protein